MGRKLACLVAFNQRSDVLYSDSDVLAFAPPAELEEVRQTMERLIHVASLTPEAAEPAEPCSP